MDDVVTKRVCFRLHVDPARIAEYRARHAAVWPDMLGALAKTGWRNYSLFLHDDGLLIGYFETDDLDASLSGMAQLEVNARWQAEMKQFFPSLGDGAPDTAFLRLTEVFNLDDQLSKAEHP